VKSEERRTIWTFCLGYEGLIREGEGEGKLEKGRELHSQTPEANGAKAHWC
jgi:hypothetical protein